MRRVAFALALVALPSCGSSGGSESLPLGDSGTIDASGDGYVDGFVDVEDGGFVTDALPDVDATAPGISKVYANTDKTLYEMDPSTKTVTKIGDFANADGTAFAETMVDIAVDASGALFGCSVNKIFTLELPSSGTGAVKATLKTSITSGTRFYALGFAPAGILDVGEALVGGDAAGDLYFIPNTGAPVNVGGFGTVVAGDPAPGVAGDVWQLSGDIAFFANAGAPVGLATIRPCTKVGDPTSCKTTNDVLVEIDMTALAKKSSTSNLKKGLIGKTGTGFGRLYGVGAWGDQVFAFQRVTTSGGVASALFLSVSLADGKGTLIKDFPDIAAAKNGWSGAGVTTAAKISIPK